MEQMGSGSEVPARAGSPDGRNSRPPSELPTQESAETPKQTHGREREERGKHLRRKREMRDEEDHRPKRRPPHTLRTRSSTRRAHNHDRENAGAHHRDGEGVHHREPRREEGGRTATLQAGETRSQATDLENRGRERGAGREDAVTGCGGGGERTAVTG